MSGAAHVCRSGQLPISLLIGNWPLSDRLGGGVRWPASSRPWLDRLAELEAWRSTDLAAAAVYRRAIATPDSEVPVFLIQLQLGRLQHQNGLVAEGKRNLLEARDAIDKDTATSNFSAEPRIQLALASEREGGLAEAEEEASHALEIQRERYRVSKGNIFLKGRVGEAHILLARILTDSHKGIEASQLARRGLTLIEESANRERASAITLDLAARRFLTVEPASLRDPLKALHFAREAVDRTAGQMPPYLTTLAFAELANHHEQESLAAAQRAITCYRRIAPILEPVLASPRYPEAAATFRYWQNQLASFTNSPTK